MVHVPFLGIDLPEPRLGQLIPSTVDTVVRGTSKLLESAHDALYPPSQADIERYQASFEASLPREFDRVRKRQAEGKIINDDQLSSELEDAGLDFYRRLLRADVLGATDEELDDVAARKLGLRRPSAQASVQEAYIVEAADQAGGLDMAAVLEEAAEQQDEERAQQLLRMQLSERAKHVGQLRGDVRSGAVQAVSTITSASAGTLLGIFLFKGLARLLQRVLRKRGPRPTAGKRLVAKASPRITEQGTTTTAPPQASRANAPAAKAASQQLQQQSKQAPSKASGSKGRPTTKRR